MRGRLIVQTFLLLAEGALVLVFANSNSLASSIVIMIFFSFCVQAAEGSTYGPWRLLFWVSYHSLLCILLTTTPDSLLIIILAANIFTCIDFCQASCLTVRTKRMQNRLQPLFSCRTNLLFLAYISGSS